MCLTLRDKDSKKPYRTAKRNIRYKVVLQLGLDYYEAPYQCCHYKLGKRYSAKGRRRGSAKFGFHVFTSRKDAERYRDEVWPKDGVVVEVKVGKFLRSGTYYSGDDVTLVTLKCETWETMTILCELKKRKTRKG